MLTKSMNMDIWVVGTLRQPCIRSSYNEFKFLKVNFCTPHSIFFNISFWHDNFKLMLHFQCCIFNGSTLKEKRDTPVFLIKKDYLVIITQKHVHLLNGGLFWKSLVSFFRGSYFFLLDLQWNLFLKKWWEKQSSIIFSFSMNYLKHFRRYLNICILL